MLDQAVKKIVSGESLSVEEAREASLELFSGEVPDALIGALLVALKMKRESVDEIEGFALGMREAKVSVNPRVERLVDTCGTGGDRKGTFNISTVAAIIAAACGVKVAKHGNRSVSSGCGSADVLEALGVNIEMQPEEVCECIERIGIGFMFAPVYHPAMKRVMGARKSLGIPTIFNIIGPLTNPAGARYQVLGVNRKDLVPTIGRVLASLGCKRGFVLNGLDGMDEFTLASETLVCEISEGETKEYVVSPEDLGLERCDGMELSGGDAKQNARIVKEILNGKPGPRFDVSIANASFALVSSGMAQSLKEGVERARLAVESGKAEMVLNQLVDFSKGDIRDVS